MIGSFWNLCRACPSMPVDKLHSEYRSTYRWHEFKGVAPTAAGGVVRQPAPAPPPSLPYSRDIFTGHVEPAMPRRKKYPGVAYKSNELFDPSAADGERLRPVITADRARSTERSDNRGGSGRRSKSEGPRQQRWTDTLETKGTATGTGLGEVLASKEPPETSTEYRNQFAWPKDEAPRKSVSMGTLKLSGKKKIPGGEGTTELEPLMTTNEDNVVVQHANKKYIEDYLWNGHKSTIPRKTTFRNALTAFITGDDRNNRKRYKSEYKKKFRPFSQYVYEASKGTFTKCRALKGKALSVEKDEGCTEKMLPSVGEGTGEAQRPGRDASWYQEVVDLRKRAGEYKHRGWGTELAPEHMTQLYDKQIELWYQVSRRSSLSALALAATNHKALPAGEKEAADSRARSPRKTRSFRSAPQQSVHAKIQEIKTQERSPQKIQRKKLQGHSFDETAVAANEGRAGAGGVGDASRRSSPRKQPGSAETTGRSPRRRPRSADPRPAVQPVVNGHDPPRTKPNDPDAVSHRSASVAKETLDDTPLVKSPPEPTRVKSPEQMNMRSPDPVNWTVPLDTGKTFTVTQNVKNELAPVHHQMSPIRKSRDSPTGAKRTDHSSKTPTTPASLTPIDETKTLNITRPLANGSHSTQLSPTDSDITSKCEVSKKLTEATQKATGVVDTAVVAENTSSFTASEVLERARNTFDKFWGGSKKEEDNV